MSDDRLVALIHNPDTAKTTLVTRLINDKARVGNHPGVTVKRRKGRGSGRRYPGCPSSCSLHSRVRA